MSTSSSEFLNIAYLASHQGRGRATRTLIVIYLLREWMKNGGKYAAPRSERPGYTVINNLLRVVRNGFEVRFFPPSIFPLSALTLSCSGQVKNAVDAAITACSDPFDLLGAIENARQQAEDSEGETRERWIAKGVRELRSVDAFLLTTSLY
jgi:hypothetical protein